MPIRASSDATTMNLRLMARERVACTLPPAATESRAV
jgi:hypothetical protein